MLDTSILLAKVETTYGTDAAPAAATDAAVVFNWQPNPMEADELRRSIERGFAGATPKVLTRFRQSHSFRLELAGSGDVDDPTLWGDVFLRACMFDEPVITAATDVAYPLEGVGDGASITIHGWKENLRHRVQGFRGNAKFNFTSGQLPYIEFTGMGLLSQDPDANTATAPTLPVYPAPLEVNTVNTDFTLGGYAALLRSFELDLGMKTTMRDLVGQTAIIFDKAEDGDRRSAGGTLVIQLPDPTAKNYFSDIRNQTNIALALTHGTVAGNIIELASTRLNLGTPTFSTEQNRLMMSAPFNLVPSAAGNEFTLKTK